MLNNSYYVITKINFEEGKDKNRIRCYIRYITCESNGVYNDTEKNENIMIYLDRDNKWTHPDNFTIGKCDITLKNISYIYDLTSLKEKNGLDTDKLIYKYVKDINTIYSNNYICEIDTKPISMMYNILKFTTKNGETTSSLKV